MKGVIFICLLSLSVCFSLPNQEAQPTAKTPVTTAPASETTIHPKEADPKAAPTSQQTPATEEKDAAKAVSTLVTPSNTKNDTKDNKTTKDDSKPTDGNTTIDPKKNDTTTVAPASVTTASTVAPSSVSTTAVPKKDETKPTEKDKNATTEKMAASTVAPAIVQARSFDGASFIGGIILTLGLLAIGFMGFKYYKNQTERNYHTL